MNIAVLTIPRELHRIYTLIGHLATKKFPIKDAQRFRIYNGWDIEDFGGQKEIVSAMVNDGHKKWEPILDYLEGGEPPDEKICGHIHGVIVEWGMMNILRDVVNREHTTLVLENDAFFRDGMDYPTILQKWAELECQVGHESIRVAMLMFYNTRHEHDQYNEGRPHIDEFWVKGSVSGGQIANIYTPHGARYMLKEKPPIPTIEHYLAANPELEGVYSASINQVLYHDFPTNFDSYFSDDYDKTFWKNFYAGMRRDLF